MQQHFSNIFIIIISLFDVVVNRKGKNYNKKDRNKSSFHKLQYIRQ